MGAEDQVIVARMDCNVVHGHRWEVPSESVPLAAAVERNVSAKLRSHEKQVLPLWMFADNGNRVAGLHI